MTMSRLQQLPVFEMLDPSRLMELEPWLEVREFQANEPVYRTGDPCDGLHAALFGAVALRTERPGEVVGQGLPLGPGDLFGEAETVARGPREMTVRALCTSKVLRIPLEPLTELLADEPTVSLLLRGLATRRRMVHARNFLLASRRKEPRIWIDRDVDLNLGGGRRATARLEDLSYGGACFANAPVSWQLGSPVIFSMGIPGHANLLHARGTIRWRSESQAGMSFEAGPMQRRQIDEALRLLAPTEN